MKHPLSRFTIAVTGDFGESRGHDKMKQWITRNGGKFTMDINSKVTHLICSKEHYRKAVLMVKQAFFLKTVHIVSFDWLEDSLMKGRPRDERDYLMAPRVKVEAATKAKKKKARRENIKKGKQRLENNLVLWRVMHNWQGPDVSAKSPAVEAFEKGVKDFENDMNSSGYGIYHDPLDNFPYDITLVRPSLLDNKNERYRLKVCSPTPAPHLSPKPLYIPPHRRILLTSNQPNNSCTSPPSNTNPNPSPDPIISTPLLPIAPPPPRTRAPLVNPRAQRLQLYVTHSVPKYYSCYVKYSAPNTNAVAEMLAPIGSAWGTAWGVFEAFFRLKTGREWGQRESGFWRMGTGSGYAQGIGERLFEYNVPPKGQPRGSVGAVDHEAVLENEVERLRGLGVAVGKGWSSREGQGEGNGGVKIGASEEEWRTPGDSGVSQQERMGPGERQMQKALEREERQERKHGKMMEGDSEAQARWEKIKRLEAGEGAAVGGDGKDDFRKWTQYGKNIDTVDYEKVLKEQKDAQSRWKWVNYK